MPRRVLVSLLISFLIFGAGFAVWLMRRTAASDPARTAATTAPGATAPAAPTALEPAPAPPTAEPAPRPRAPGPRAEAAPEPAAPDAPTTGTLHIESDVPGAQVFLDRRFIGAAPITETDVAPGPHRINVTAQGYESLAENIDVVPGPRELRFNFKEIQLDATLAVVHKHRFGSCKGQLVATAQGVRYETTDKDDAFVAALADFETFEVDYLAKVLKVKPKKGKRYDFTDPEANADRLFVFHRDVDKARQRAAGSQ